ncbi:MAG: endonuclease V [Propionibacteriales bacterium]|nr:endonuclease V [Propionibacteriales bacterium]
MGYMWPRDAETLVEAQRGLAAAEPRLWSPPADPRVGACWVCFPRGLTGRGAEGDPAWVAAVVIRGSRMLARHVIRGEADAPYTPGLLALRIGRLLEDGVRGLDDPPDVLLVDATGRDHPLRCGLAVHLGARLDLPTVGVTHRPLQAEGGWPDDRAGAMSPLRIRGEVVGCWLRTREGTRPLAVHPGWRVGLDDAVAVVTGCLSGRRTPEPLRQARRVARRARRS